jgi:hypothetical protein
MLMRTAAAACLVGASLMMAGNAEARCQGCFEGPMIVDTVPYYAPVYYLPYGPAYYAPRYYYWHRRHVRYAPYIRGYYPPRRFYVRPYW